MRKGNFTAEQDVHLNTYMPELLQKLGAGVRSVELTRWKQSVATKALGTSAFADLDVSTIPRTEWFKLFARDFHDEIGAIAAQRVADTSINAAAAHQIVLKEMWDALSAEEKSDWDSQAEDEAADVESNQKEFSTNIHLALRSLCQGGLLGDAEMILFYGFRDTKNGDLLAGTVVQVAESVIPRGWRNIQLSGCADRYLRPGSLTLASVTVDEDGTVNFPSVDLDNTPVANIRVFSKTIWKNAGTMNTVKTLILGEFFNSICPSEPFHFVEEITTVALPPTPPPPPPPPAHNLDIPPPPSPVPTTSSRDTTPTPPSTQPPRQSQGTKKEARIRERDGGGKQEATITAQPLFLTLLFVARPVLLSRSQKPVPKQGKMIEIWARN
ncbi:hypothetical protein B0H13DRAFT_1856059 [Mycena leptocephala]|nr:hypothetical protein B0H13DRAFT_1856059 [Mycena leptocephala]